MKRYTVIGGVNGVGKSSLTGVLKSRLDDLGIIIDVDKLTAANGGDLIAGGREAVNKIESCIEKGICFTQETTLSGKRTLKTMRDARERGYFVRLYYVGLDSLEESISRITNRVLKGGHHIPDEYVRRRFEKKTADLADILPYCDEATFFDNNNGFVEVGIYRNVEIITTVSQTPDWFKDIIIAFQNEN